MTRRRITFTNESNENEISWEEYVENMKAYGKEISKTVRSSRKYLRSLGMNIDYKGNIVLRNTKSDEEPPNVKKC